MSLQVACLVYILPLMDGFHFGLPLLDALVGISERDLFEVLVHPTVELISSDALCS